MHIYKPENLENVTLLVKVNIQIPKSNLNNIKKIQEHYIPENMTKFI